MQLLYTVKMYRESVKLYNYLNSLTVKTYGVDTAYNERYDTMIFVDGEDESIYIVFDVLKVSNIDEYEVVDIIKKWCGHENYKAVL